MTFSLPTATSSAHAIFDEAGNFIGADFIVLGSNVLDAGSEVNDEIPANTAFFGQMAPNTGVARERCGGTGRGLYSRRPHPQQ
jgi:hypothetical protein